MAAADDDVGGMLTQMTVDEQADSAAPEPLSPPAEGELAEAVSTAEAAEVVSIVEAGVEVVPQAETTPAPVPVLVEFIKTKEAIRRPPLPEPGLYDIFVRKPLPVIRRPVVTVEEASGPTPTPGDDPRMVRLDTPMVSNTDALAALEAWSAMGPRRKPRS